MVLPNFAWANDDIEEQNISRRKLDLFSPHYVTTSTMPNTVPDAEMLQKDALIENYENEKNEENLKLKHFTSSNCYYGYQRTNNSNYDQQTLHNDESDEMDLDGAVGGIDYEITCQQNHDQQQNQRRKRIFNCQTANNDDNYCTFNVKRCKHNSGNDCDFDDGFRQASFDPSNISLMDHTDNQSNFQQNHQHQENNFSLNCQQNETESYNSQRNLLPPTKNLNIFKNNRHFLENSNKVENTNNDSLKLISNCDNNNMKEQLLESLFNSIHGCGWMHFNLIKDDEI